MPQDAAPLSSGPDATPGVSAAWVVLQGVADPEIPVLSVVDLGIIRSVDLGPDGLLRVGISPTYSGCPATEVIRANVGAALRDAGFQRVAVTEVLSPPWTTDWITAEGRERLREYGITPPAAGSGSVRGMLRGDLPVACPRCASPATQRVSEFGSTPCKALYRCTACLEPFDYFKCI
jgi:ring-1,2-phenylacetyl-CoA epoxidase subunit PaaD